MKRLLAALLTLSMLVGIVPFSAFAESPGAVPETFAAAQESPADTAAVLRRISDIEVKLKNGVFKPSPESRVDVPMLAEEFLRAGIDFDFNKCRLIDAQTIFMKMEQIGRASCRERV